MWGKSEPGRRAWGVSGSFYVLGFMVEPYSTCQCHFFSLGDGKSDNKSSFKAEVIHCTAVAGEEHRKNIFWSENEQLKWSVYIESKDNIV